MIYIVWALIFGILLGYSPGIAIAVVLMGLYVKRHADRRYEALAAQINDLKRQLGLEVKEPEEDDGQNT